MIKVWVCNIKGRAYINPKDPIEYTCMSMAGGNLFMQIAHREAHCGYYIKAE